MKPPSQLMKPPSQLQFTLFEVGESTLPQCQKISDNDDDMSMVSSPKNKMSKLIIDGGNDEINVVCERLLLDLKVEAGKIKDVILKEQVNGGGGEGSSVAGEKVWNFRTRKGLLEREERGCWNEIFLFPI